MAATLVFAATARSLAPRSTAPTAACTTAGPTSHSNNFRLAIAATPATASLVQAQLAVLKRAGLDPILWPRNAGSYPGYIFTNAPLSLPSAHFGLGHGGGAHAPDEYYVIESANPKVQGFDGAAMSFAEYLFELGK